MQYPPEFIAECKRLYPDWPALYKRIEEGASIVGRYLDDTRMTGLPFAAILAATTLESLQERARRMIDEQALYQRWCELYEQQVLAKEARDAEA